MSKESVHKELNIENQSRLSKIPEITPFDLRLVNKRIKIKFSNYKISTVVKNMFESETLAISQNGILFTSENTYEKGTIMRVWIELPDYWGRKSKHVEYRHTEAPSHFQMLARVLSCEEKNTNTVYLFEVLCECLSIDSIDATVLQDYIISSSGARVA